MSEQPKNESWRKEIPPRFEGEIEIPKEASEQETLGAASSQEEALMREGVVIPQASEGELEEAPVPERVLPLAKQMEIRDQVATATFLARAPKDTPFELNRALIDYFKNRDNKDQKE